ncbi:MAG: AbrB/MazE/SpoVT family DNA-binding domain-containing protein [Dehalococcoidia bacterium]
MDEPRPASRQCIASVTRQGQVTIPAEVSRLLGVAPLGKVAFVIEGETVRLAPSVSVVAATAGLLKDTLPVLSPQEEKAADEMAMAEEAAGP